MYVTRVVPWVKAAGKLTRHIHIVRPQVAKAKEALAQEMLSRVRLSRARRGLAWWHDYAQYSHHHRCGSCKCRHSLPASTQRDHQSRAGSRACTACALMWMLHVSPLPALRPSPLDICPPPSTPPRAVLAYFRARHLRSEGAAALAAWRAAARAAARSRRAAAFRCSQLLARALGAWLVAREQARLALAEGHRNAALARAVLRRHWPEGAAAMRRKHELTAAAEGMAAARRVARALAVWGRFTYYKHMAKVALHWRIRRLASLVLRHWSKVGRGRCSMHLSSCAHALRLPCSLLIDTHARRLTHCQAPTCTCLVPGRPHAVRRPPARAGHRPPRGNLRRDPDALHVAGRRARPPPPSPRGRGRRAARVARVGGRARGAERPRARGGGGGGAGADGAGVLLLALVHAGRACISCQPLRLALTLGSMASLCALASIICKCIRAVLCGAWGVAAVGLFEHLRGDATGGALFVAHSLLRSCA